MKKSKLATPDWILKGQKAPLKKKAEKTFSVRRCPKCKSDDVGVVLGDEEGKGRGEWECRKCKWKGFDIKEEDLTEDGFMKYLDDKGEPIE
jgi:hypothetical protein